MTTARDSARSRGTGPNDRKFTLDDAAAPELTQPDQPHPVTNGQRTQPPPDAEQDGGLPLWQWGRLALVLVLVGAITGFVGAMLWPPTYAARASILYEISQEKPTGFLREDRSLTTQLVLLRGRQVLAPVAAANGMPVEDLEKDLTVTLLDSSEVIEVEARADTRDAARRLTRQVVDGYLAVAAKDATAPVEAYLREQLSAVQGELTAARTEAEEQRELQALGSGANQSERYAAEATVQSIEGREQQLLTQLDELTTVQLTASRPEVIASAYPVPDAVSPRPGFATGAGALMGLVIATGVVGLLAHRRNQVSKW